MMIKTLAFMAVAAQAATHIVKSAENAAQWGEIVETEAGMHVKDEYIVMFHKDAASKFGDGFKAQHMSLFTEDQIMHEYYTGGYAVKMNAEMAAKVADMPEVKFVEHNQIAWATDCAPAIPMNAGVWGTIRSNNANLVISGEYYEELGAGTGIDSYVADTGIDTTHNAFEGRAVHGIDYTGEGNGDGNGHGTHVAGTMVGSGFGIAQEGVTKAVKVLGAGGSGTFANVIAGILWTATDTRDSGREHGVVNLSLGGGFSQAVNQAIDDIFDLGVIAVVAAGNSNADACNSSPAAAYKSICVGSTDSSDRRSTFSNHGCCVDIYAPGTAILSTTPNQGTASYSGTSMAAPHIAGIVQAYWTTNPETPPRAIKDEVSHDITDHDRAIGGNFDRLTNGVFSGACTGTQCSGTEHCADSSTWFNNILGYARCVN